jgi:excisionase family DNA binding protein
MSCMKISAQKAAALLGVSRMQVSRLVSAGEIKAERFGNALQVDLDSLHRYQDLRPRPGRPARPDVAWELLRHANPRGLRDLHALAIAVRRRADRHELRVLPGSLNRLLDDHRVVVSGTASAAHAGAAVQDRPPYDLYIRRSDYSALVKEYRMRVSDEPNLIVRVAPDDAWLFERGRRAPMVVSMVDMVDDRDDRSASEAVRARAEA